jgi:predicted ArsR family transcriptional regulator
MAVNLLDLVADPVRLSIVREISGNAGISLADLAGRAGVHVNTVRAHMGELEAAGLVEREHVAAVGPGRPQICYRLCDGWRLPSTDLAGLGELLAALVIRLDPDPEEVEAFGRQWGRFLSGRPGGDSVAGLPRLLEGLGFDAKLDGLEIRLGSCPCPVLSPDRPELICRLVGATIEGILEMSQRGLGVCSAKHDPDRRTCTVRMSELAGQGA